MRRMWVLSTSVRLMAFSTPLRGSGLQLFVFDVLRVTTLFHVVVATFYVSRPSFPMVFLPHLHSTADCDDDAIVAKAYLVAQKTAEVPQVHSMAELDDHHLVRQRHRELWNCRGCHQWPSLKTSTSCCSGNDDGTENCGSTAGAFDVRVEDNPGDMQQYCKALGGGNIPLTAYVMAVVFAGGGKGFSYRCPLVFPSSSILVFPLRQVAEVPQAPLMGDVLVRIPVKLGLSALRQYAVMDLSKAVQLSSA